MTKITIEENVATKAFGDLEVSTIFRDNWGGTYIKLNGSIEEGLGAFNAVGLGSGSLYQFSDDVEMTPVSEVIIKV